MVESRTQDEDQAADGVPLPTTVVHAHAHLARSPLPLWLALILAALCGALTATQSRINGQFAAKLGDGVLASAISFGSGLLILLVVLLLWRPGRQGVARLTDAVRGRRIAWWGLCGGLAGAFFVLSQSLTAAALGVALFTVSIVAGQTVAGLVFDIIGLGPGGKRPASPMRVLGALLALGAVSWAVSAQLSGDVPFWMMLMPLVAGIGSGYQQAVNGRVQAASESTYAATLLNFTLGTTVLLIATLVHVASVGWPAAFPTEPWLYIGGAVGCVFIAGMAVLVRFTGVLLMSLANVAGQLSAALLLDLLLPTAGTAIGIATVGGTVLAIVAVAVASVRWRTKHAH